MNRKSRGNRINVLVLTLALLLAGVWVWKVYCEVRQENFNHALIAAIKNKDTNTALSFLTAGANANAIDVPPDLRSMRQRLWDTLRGKRSNPPKNAHTAIRVVIGSPFDYSPVDGEENTPTENVVLMKALLDRGASANVRDERGETPLMLASLANYHHTILLLLDHGANPNEGDSPLDLAAKHGDLVVIQRLIEKGAKVNRPNVSAEVPLFSAIYADHEGSVRLLLDRGADINCLNQWGGTVLHAAVVNARATTLKLLLLHKGVDINARDSMSQTALHIAVDRQDHAKVKLLLDAGADARVRDNLGKTPLSYAQDDGNRKDIIDLLREAERKQPIRIN